MVRNLSCRALADMIGGNDPIQIIDVREAWEVEICFLDGATHIPLGQLAERINEIDPSRPVAMLCHHGVRSRHGAMYLEANGFSDIFNIAGGIDAWALEIAPDMQRYE
jgi:rhodanese-related sulfurtransferase